MSDAMRAIQLFIMLWAMLLTLGTSTLPAGVIYQSPTGASPLMGYIAVDDPSLAGTQYVHPDIPLDRFNVSNIIDGDLATYGNTYSGTEIAPATGNNTAPLDFVGVLWNTPQNSITSIRLHHALFFDGGWFGTAVGDLNSLNSFPPNSLSANQADAADVAAPTVQITIDGGSTWTSISASDNYVSVIQPVVLAENSSQPPPVTFNFSTQNGIDGIRLVGYGGGRSDIPGGRDEQGFIAVREFEIGVQVQTATVPEPSSMALWAICTLGVVSRRRRR